MRIPESADLVFLKYKQDEHGVQRKVEAKKTVYGYYGSVSAAEIFDGGRNGINPEFRFTMTELDYAGETVLIREGRRYAVYRTYRPGNGTVELYVQRKGGTNG